MKYYKPKHLLFILPILIIFGAYLAYTQFREAKEAISVSVPAVVISNTIISVEIADEASEQWQGLSDRANLGENNGMLFVFSDLQKRTFVMRRMHFPLDIVWIRNNKIVGIAENLPPEGEKPTEFYHSPEQVNYVLELNGGFCDEQGIRVGDEIIFNF